MPPISPVLDFTGLTRLTNISQLRHGMRVCGVTGDRRGDRYFPEAMISFDRATEPHDGAFYLCQNYMHGDYCPDRFHFTESWSVRYDASGDFPGGYTSISHSNMFLQLYALPEGMVAGPAPLFPAASAAPRTTAATPTPRTRHFRRVRLERPEQVRHLMHVSGTIDGCHFDDGVIDYQEGRDYFHVCQNVSCGEPIADRHGYAYSWVRSMSRLSDTATVKLFFDEETPEEEPLEAATDGAPVKLQYFKQLKHGKRVHGTLGGKPLESGLLVVRNRPDCLYVLNDVAGRGTVTDKVKSYLRMFYATPGGLFKYAWMIPVVDGVLCYSPETELFMNVANATAAAAPATKIKVGASRVPTLAELEDTVQFTEVKLRDQLRDDLPLWVVAYDGRITPGALSCPLDEPRVGYICTNNCVLDGSPVDDRHGFDYSWSFTIPDHPNRPQLGLGGMRLFVREV